MKVKFLTTVMGVSALGMLSSCSKKTLVVYEPNDIKILVEKGDTWLHDFPLFAGIKIKNTPQIAIWVEDTAGNYVSTIFVTRKIATEAWIYNRGNRRKESLPVWCFARGVQYADGLYLPTKKEPLVDAVTGATPKGNFDVKIRPIGVLKQFVIKIEINHSTDWNDNYPKNAQEGDINYSGGEGGSGQPAIVYATTIDLDSDKKQYIANIVGHSSPDGSNGDIFPDISSLTSALNIIKNITINIQ